MPVATLRDRVRARITAVAASDALLKKRLIRDSGASDCSPIIRCVAGEMPQQRMDLQDLQEVRTCGMVVARIRALYRF